MFFVVEGKVRKKERETLRPPSNPKRRKL